MSKVLVLEYIDSDPYDGCSEILGYFSGLPSENQINIKFKEFVLRRGKASARELIKLGITYLDRSKDTFFRLYEATVEEGQG